MVYLLLTVSAKETLLGNIVEISSQDGDKREDQTFVYYFVVNAKRYWWAKNLLLTMTVPHVEVSYDII